jgi:chitosanase
MDIDCDGVDWQCPYNPLGITLTDSGNPDGQPQTDWGNLSAYQTPYIVVPNSAVHKLFIPENAISVVICAGQMFYAIMGDTNGDTPEVIGEASWLMGQTCFPNDGLNGGKGHVPPDVLCTYPSTGRED